MTKKTAPDILRIAVAQLNPTVGDVAGNLAKAREARADAARQGADIVLFTELFLAGYPPEDLVLKPAFLKICEKAAQDFAADTADGGPGVIIGTPLKRKRRAQFHHFRRWRKSRRALRSTLRGESTKARLRAGLRSPSISAVLSSLVRGHLGAMSAFAILAESGRSTGAERFAYRAKIVCRRSSSAGHRCRLPMIYANQLGSGRLI